jgi:hypothetical protein
MNIITRTITKLVSRFTKPQEPKEEPVVWAHISTAPQDETLIIVTNEAHEFEFPALWTDEMDDMSGMSHTGWAQQDGNLAMDEEEFCLWRPMTEQDELLLV